MDVSIRYTQTADGVKIAFWTLGDGEPFVYMAGAPWSHVELLEIPECVRWYERLAEDRMLVRYDVRGTGLSDREIEDHSLDAQLLDLESVIDSLGLEKFSVFGAANAGPVAIAYAAANPERVSNLILWCTWANGAEIISPRLDAWRALLDHDWQLMTDTCAHLALGWSGGEVGRRAAENLRASVTPGVMRAALDAVDAVDITSSLENVSTPTLIFTRPNISWIPVESARNLAARIPGARLFILDGESTAPYMGDTELVVDTIHRFFASNSGPAATPHDLTTSEPTAASGILEATGKSDPGRPSDLTAREAQVLGMLASGKTNNEVAKELVLSIRTVERHIGNIYSKIGARGRADATVFALTHGLV